MKQFGIVAIFLEDAYRADGRACDDLEAEIAVEGVCSLTVSTTTLPLPKSSSWSVKLAGEIQFGRCLAGSFLTRRPAPSRFSHAASFFLKRAGGLGVPSE